MADTYAQRGPLSPDAPAYGAVTIDISSTDHDCSKIRVRGVYIGTGGALKVDLADGSTGQIFNNTVAGSILPIQVIKIYKTGTAAAGLLLL